MWWWAHRRAGSFAYFNNLGDCELHICNGTKDYQPQLSTSSTVATKSEIRLQPRKGCAFPAAYGQSEVNQRIQFIIASRTAFGSKIYIRVPFDSVPTCLASSGRRTIATFKGWEVNADMDLGGTTLLLTTVRGKL